MYLEDEMFAIWFLLSPIDAFYNAFFLLAAVWIYNLMLGRPSPAVQEAKGDFSSSRTPNVKIAIGQSYLICLSATLLLYSIWTVVILTMREKLAINTRPDERWDMFAYFQGVYFVLLILVFRNSTRSSLFQSLSIAVIQRLIPFALFSMFVFALTCMKWFFPP